jgi:hypothetical protein
MPTSANGKVPPSEGVEPLLSYVPGNRQICGCLNAAGQVVADVLSR